MNASVASAPVVGQRVADLNSACSPYGYAWEGLHAVSDVQTRRKLEKRFKECSKKLRILVCRDAGFHPRTTWLAILYKAGWIRTIRFEEMKKRHGWAEGIKLSPEATELCDELEDIRFSITGRL